MQSATPAATGAQFDCVKCGNSKYPLLTNTTNGNVTFVVGTTGGLTCATQYAGTDNISADVVANCDRVVAITGTGNTKDTGCALCAAGKGANAIDTCTGTITANCSQERFDGTNPECYVPAASYALPTVTGGTPAS